MERPKFMNDKDREWIRQCLAPCKCGADYQASIAMRGDKAVGSYQPSCCPKCEAERITHVKQ